MLIILLCSHVAHALFGLQSARMHACIILLLLCWGEILLTLLNPQQLHMDGISAFKTCFECNCGGSGPVSPGYLLQEAAPKPWRRNLASSATGAGARTGQCPRPPSQRPVLSPCWRLRLVSAPVPSSIALQRTPLSTWRLSSRPLRTLTSRCSASR